MQYRLNYSLTYALGPLRVTDPICDLWCQSNVHCWIYRKVPEMPPPPQQKKKGSCLNVRISVTATVALHLFSISGKQMVPVHDYEKRYTEAFAITKIRTFNYKFVCFVFLLGAGEGAYFWYFTVLWRSIFPAKISSSPMITTDLTVLYIELHIC